MENVQIGTTGCRKKKILFYLMIVASAENLFLLLQIFTFSLENFTDKL